MLLSELPELRQDYLEALCDINLDLLLLSPLEDLAKHDVCDLLHLTLGQLSEHNDLIEPARASNLLTHGICTDT